MVIIVIDTNVFVSACLGSPACVEVVAACLRGDHQPLMGAALLAEIEEQMGREKPWTSCRLTGRERADLLDAFLSRCEWTRIFFGWRPNLRDEGDNHIVELAVAGGASRIVTRNVRDFSSMELRFPALKVRSPEAFLKETA